MVKSLATNLTISAGTSCDLSVQPCLTTYVVELG